LNGAAEEHQIVYKFVFLLPLDVQLNQPELKEVLQ
jgi:hypothetical protein